MKGSKKRCQRQKPPTFLCRFSCILVFSLPDSFGQFPEIFSILGYLFMVSFIMECIVGILAVLCQAKKIPFPLLGSAPFDFIKRLDDLLDNCWPLVICILFRPPMCRVPVVVNEAITVRTFFQKSSESW